MATRGETNLLQINSDLRDRSSHLEDERAGLIAEIDGLHGSLSDSAEELARMCEQKERAEAKCGEVEAVLTSLRSRLSEERSLRLNLQRDLDETKEQLLTEVKVESDVSASSAREQVEAALDAAAHEQAALELRASKAEALVQHHASELRKVKMELSCLVKENAVLRNSQPSLATQEISPSANNEVVADLVAVCEAELSCCCSV